MTTTNEMVERVAADKYTEPRRENGAIHFSLALQDGSRQPWVVKDTLSNWHFAWWVHACDRPPSAIAAALQDPPQ